MRWLVTGAAGMLGTDVTEYLRAQGEEVTPAARGDVDITDERAVDAAVAGHQLVLNCAAWTAVDDAEARESEAFAVNAVGPALLARCAGRRGARLVHVSTDYVFDGHAREPYADGALPRPRSAYGRTKAAGEWAVRAETPNRHLVVRAAWLYGAHGPCFPKTLVRAVAENGAVSVVDDQVGQPTWTRDVADFLFRLVKANAPGGVFHATSWGHASWFQFAQEICRSAGYGSEVVRPITSAEFVRPAPRPAYSVLDHSASESIGVRSIGDWRERWRAAASSVLP